MRRVLRWITANWMLKLVSLLLATLFWISYNTEPNAEIGMAVPLEFHSIPHGLEISGDIPVQAIVRLRARATLLRHLAPGDVSASLDMSRTSAGDASFALEPEDVSVPYGVHVVLISPSEVHVKLIPRENPSAPR
jgi:YbbR domain-containing protein